MARSSWHDQVFFGIHYDLHARETDTVLGAETTRENLREMLQRVKPDWIQCDCKGHPGWTSWPTRVGSTPPKLVRDALQVHADVCRELGIKLGMHYSGVIDQRALELHPEWGTVNADGVLGGRSTCRLSPYLDELMIPQMLELIDTYDVDGFWVDGDNWATQPCWCEQCRAEFARRTGVSEAPANADSAHWEAWVAFHRDLFVEYVTKYADAVHARKPDCAVCSNWMYTIRQPEPKVAPTDYLSGDYMPNFGMYRAALEARFLDSRDVSWDLMCWGFVKNGDGRSIFKPARHLCQELAEVVALGGAAMIYGKPQRTGHLIGWHHDIMADVAEFCRARKPFCFGSETVPQAAVLHLPTSYYAANAPCFNYGAAIDPVEGALHALLETHRSTDILNEEEALARLGEYKLVVVPKQTRLTSELTATLEAFAAEGGSVIMSGPHLAEEVPDLVGATPAGEPRNSMNGSDAWGAVFIETDGEAASVAGPWHPVQCTDAEPHALGLANSEPGKDGTGIPVITRRAVGNGAIVAIHCPLFRDYFRAHCPRQRRLFAKLVADLGIEWLVELEDAPPYLELILRRQGDRLMINLINRGSGEMSYTNRAVIECMPPVQGAKLRLAKGMSVAECLHQPNGTPLTVSVDRSDGRPYIQAPNVDIHEVIEVRIGETCY